MTETTTEPRLRAILADHFKVPPDQLPDDFGSANLVSDFPVDSLDMIELLMAIEEEFAIDITDAEAERAMGRDGDQPLSNLVALIDAKLAEVV